MSERHSECGGRFDGGDLSFRDIFFVCFFEFGWEILG